MPRSCTLLLVLALLLGGCELFDNRAEEEAPPGPAQRFELPAPSGPFAVGTTTLHWVDASREERYTPEPNDPRELVVQLWYPTDATTGSPAPYMEPEVLDFFAAFQDYTTPDSVRRFVSRLRTNSLRDAPLSSAEATYPVVLFSHGLTGVRAVETTYMEDLASHGYVVAGIDHAYGSLATVFPDGRVAPFSGRISDFPTIVDIWTADLSFVLDELARLHADDPAGRFTGGLDLSRVGAVGHSAGGSAAAQAMVVDRRFDAGASLDAPQVGPATTQGFDEPFLFVFAEGSQYFETTLQDRLRARGYQLTLDGTTHYSFTDLPVLLDLAALSPTRAAESTRPPGTLDPERNLEILNTFIVAFFDRHLRGQAVPLLGGAPAGFPEVTFEIINGGPTS